MSKIKTNFICINDKYLAIKKLKMEKRNKLL